MNKPTPPLNEPSLPDVRNAGFIRQPCRLKATFRLALLLVLGAGWTLAHAQTTAFNYTGYLLDGGSPANGIYAPGLYDLRHRLPQPAGHESTRLHEDK